MATTDTTTLPDVDLAAFTSRYVAAWNEQRPDAIAELITDDIFWFDPALPQAARSVAEVQEFMRASFRAFPDLRFAEPDPPHLSVAGNEVAWAWTMRGTMTGELSPPGFAPTGRSMHVEGVDLWRFRDGRIENYRAYYDVTDLARQLGIMPAAGSGAERATVALQRLQARFQRR
jgi:steroid delta-isomerase-like uncharacterized protein